MKIEDSNLTLILILVILCIFGLIIGYILGRLESNKGVLIEQKPRSFFDKETMSVEEKVSIDNKKYVVDIKTTGMEKKYNSLGETKESNDNISSSINKLKSMKG